MLLQIVSYNGHALNDTNFSAWFPRGMPTMPGASAEYAARSQTFPKLANKRIEKTTLRFEVECKGTIHTQYETLKSWFPIDDYTLRALVVKDTADSDRQWYVMGYPIEPVTPVDDGAGGYVITLAIDDPFWRSVDKLSATWDITASGQTKALTILGNSAARLKFEITPSAKGLGYQSKQWYPWRNPLTVANGMPLEITNGGINTSALLQDASNKCQLNGAVDATQTTIAFDTVTGTIPTYGMGYFDTEQISWTGRTGPTSGDLTGVTRGIGGTTAATHADNAEIKVSKILANLNDLRVFDGAAEIGRWTSGISTTTKVWVNLLWSPKIELTLQGSIASSGDVTSITVKKTSTNLAMLKRLPATFMFYIGSEVFYGKTPNAAKYTFDVTGRAAKNTSMAAHADGAVIYWLEHDLNILYGDLSASAPYTDETRKPIIDLASSTNTSWVYTVFASDDGLRAGGAIPFIEKVGAGKQSAHYTATHGADADPVTDAGIVLRTYSLNAKPKAETASLFWQFFHPAGFVTITVAGEKYRALTDYPKTAGLQKSQNGKKWTAVFTEASPSAAATWQALSTHSGVSLSGNYPYLMWTLDGTLKVGTLTAPNEAYLEMSGATFVLESANVMQAVSITPAEESNYYLDAALTVVVSSVDGDAITLKHQMKAGETMTVDCAAEEITHNGLLINPIGFNSRRNYWLDVPPGSSSLRYDDAGTSSMEIIISGEYRNTL